MSDDVEITADWDGNALTPVSRVCPDCTGEQIVLANFVPPPRNIREAWAIQRCCGTGNQELWRWCWVTGAVTEPRNGTRTSYDRRKSPR